MQELDENEKLEEIRQKKATKRNRSNSSISAKKIKIEYAMGAFKNALKKYQHPTVELEAITKHLDTKTCLNMLLLCKEINFQLVCSPAFWKHLCSMENFLDYKILKIEETEGEFNIAMAEHSYCEDASKRLSWSLEVFHDVQVNSNSPKWGRVFQRGIEMRRNICRGKFELWRLFMTDAKCLPVKKMTKNTLEEELRSYHKHSRKAKDPKRRVRINRYWNEDFLVAVQYSRHVRFNELYIWKWKDGQQPEFMYSFDMYEQYPRGLYPTAFFLWKHYLVLMPDACSAQEDLDPLISMIRIHDLKDHMKLVGSYDFPQESRLRRSQQKPYPSGIVSDETAHLHKLGDKAVGLCRTVLKQPGLDRFSNPKLTLFVFNLPDGQLLKIVNLFGHFNSPLETYDLDTRFLMKDNTMIFVVHDPYFFAHFFTPNQEDDDGTNRQKRYGKLLYVDFDGIANTANGDGKIKLKVDESFDCNDDCIEKFSLLSSDCMAVLFASGKIIIRKLTTTVGSPNACTSIDELIIPCPEKLKRKLDAELDQIDVDDHSLCTSKNGKVILVMRHFESGRRIHAYDISRKDFAEVLYTIDLDESSLNLTKIPGYISIDMDGRFLCAADQDKLVIWNAQNGKFIRSIAIPAHYDFMDDENERDDRYCWKGHTDFAFSEDGIIIIHSQRYFPIAADVLLFW